MSLRRRVVVQLTYEGSYDWVASTLRQSLFDLNGKPLTGGPATIPFPNGGTITRELITDLHDPEGEKS